MGLRTSLYAGRKGRDTSFVPASDILASLFVN